MQPKSPSTRLRAVAVSFAAVLFLTSAWPPITKPCCTTLALPAAMTAMVVTIWLWMVPVISMGRRQTAAVTAVALVPAG
jgi:hypothetical protein